MSIRTSGRLGVVAILVAGLAGCGGESGGLPMGDPVAGERLVAT